MFIVLREKLLMLCLKSTVRCLDGRFFLKRIACGVQVCISWHMNYNEKIFQLPKIRYFLSLKYVLNFYFLLREDRGWRCLLALRAVVGPAPGSSRTSQYVTFQHWLNIIRLWPIRTVLLFTETTLNSQHVAVKF